MPDNASTAVATRESNPLVQLREQLEQRAGELKMVLPSHISPEKFQRTVLTAAQQNPDLLTCDRRSLILACMKAAQDALLPDGREAVIYPFNTSVKVGGQWVKKKIAQYVPMVFGLRKKILQSGEIAALEVGVVYRKEHENGYFRYEVGTEPPLNHVPMLDLSMDDAKDENIVGTYSIATMKDGTKSYEFMRRFEIDKVRECSQTGATRDKRGQPRTPSGPWVEWYPEQCKKTVMRRHSKVLPQSGDLIVDVEGRELESGMSAVALLGSASVEPEHLITDESGNTIDTTTGEVVEPEQDIRDDERGDDGDDDQGEAVNDADTDEQTGITKDPAEAKADEYIEKMNKAELLPDLRKLYKEVSPHLSAMPGGLSLAIDEAYDRNERRLKQAEPVK